MKRLLALSLLIFTFFTATAQKRKLDTLRVNLSKAHTDTTIYMALRQLGNRYYISNPDSSIMFDQQAYLIAKKNNWYLAQANCFNGIANSYATMGDYATGIQYYLKSLRAFERIKFMYGISEINDNIGATYIQKGDFVKALPYLQIALKQGRAYSANHKLTHTQKRSLPIALLNLGECYLDLKKMDSAKYYIDASYKSAQAINYSDEYGSVQRDLGEIEQIKGNKANALQYFRQAFITDRAIQDVENLSIAYLSMAKFYHNYKLQDSAVYYAKRALDTAAAGKYVQDVLNAGTALTQYYDEMKDLPDAYKYLKITIAAKDSLYSQDKVKQLLTLDFNEKERQQELQTEQKEAQQKVQNQLRTYILSGGLGVLALLAIIFWRNSNQRKKANLLLSKQKQEIEEQRDQTNKALTELKLTQTQLIQSEKMASLGELTAGIAHEIQNPLNFVNNFSEVNKEMLEELKAESEKPKAERNEQLEVELIDGLIENEKKITHHGKRADFIVKGMLQHSRTSTGEKQETNINVLADEFLKLSYHGLRAKDKNFNAELVTNFDEKLPKVNIAQQDIGRVLLNLFNNAFYAVNQKRKTTGANYKPEVSVTTTIDKGKLVVKVKDNGAGIPDTIKDKILQPFFTTKPTGEGTGLGLSLSYDILVKGHGGTLEINSKEGEGAEFVVRLPLG